MGGVMKTLGQSILVISIIVLLMCILPACSRVYYHDSFGLRYPTQKWNIDWEFNNLRWLTPACGDSARLADLTGSEEMRSYFQNFKPDSGVWYYTLAVTGTRYDSMQSPPKFVVGFVEIDSVSVFLDHVEKVIDIDHLFCHRPPTYGGPKYISIGPLPLPEKAERAEIAFVARIRESEAGTIEDTVKVTVNVDLKRKTRTLFDMWP